MRMRTGAQRPGCLQVNAHGLKRLRAIHGEVIGIAAARRIGRQPSERLKVIVKRDAQCARHVIVASARSA